MRRPGPTGWHRLDPLTRLTIATSVVVASSLIDGVATLGLLLALGVLLPAGIARVAGVVLRDAILLATPLALSVIVVNALLFPGGTTTVAELGPFRVTAEGLAFGLLVVVRVVTIAGALVLFSRTTRPAELVASLERHGVPARLTFVIHQAFVLVPRTLERAATVATAQRARGLDTESSPWRRARGLLAVAAPTVLGAIEEAEVRTLALEARGFGRPGRRTLLWAPSDSAIQRVARWSLVGSLLLVLGLRIAGVEFP